MRKRIKLTESQLHDVIRKCINEALEEIGDTHPGGRIGFAQHAADLAIERGRTKQGQNILNSFQDSYNSTREDNSPELCMYPGSSSFMSDYVGDTLHTTRERGSNSFINQNTTEGGFEDFRKPYQNLPAKQRNDSNKRIDDFQKYAQWSKSQGKRHPKYKGHNFTPKASNDDYTDDYGTSYDD